MPFQVGTAISPAIVVDIDFRKHTAIFGRPVPKMAPNSSLRIGSTSGPRTYLRRGYAHSAQCMLVARRCAVSARRCRSDARSHGPNRSLSPPHLHTRPARSVCSDVSFCRRFNDFRGYSFRSAFVRKLVSPYTMAARLLGKAKKWKTIRFLMTA